MNLEEKYTKLKEAAENIVSIKREDGHYTILTVHVEKLEQVLMEISK